MKKQLLALAFVSMSAAAAQASVVCNTNTSGDPKLPSTIIVVDKIKGQLTAAVHYQGGLSHMVTAPTLIPVEAKNYGPEVVFYINADRGFQLQVGFQPMGGKLYGTLTENEKQTPVICKSVNN